MYAVEENTLDALEENTLEVMAEKYNNMFTGRSASLKSMEKKTFSQTHMLVVAEYAAKPKHQRDKRKSAGSCLRR